MEATQTKKLRGPWVAVAIAANIVRGLESGDRRFDDAVHWAKLHAEYFNAGKCALMIAVKMAEAWEDARRAKLLKNCIVEPGTVVKLANGETATVGGGGTYRINGDVYPVTILAVSKKKHRIIYRGAKSHRGLYTEDPGAPLKVATLRKWRSDNPEDWSYCPRYSNYSFVYTRGYDSKLDPSF